MDHPVLIIEAPELDDASIAKLHDFIHELLMAFEEHYYHQLRRRVCSEKVCENNLDHLHEDQYPF